jgi:glucose-1-phosphate thymidylyltransferase
MLAGIRKIAIISTPEQRPNFESLLGDGSRFGVEISHLTQVEPRGLADAYLVADDFLKGSPSALILGDNLFYGVGLGQSLATQADSLTGASVLAATVSDPESYGILKLDNSGSVTEIVEKPLQYSGSLAIPGLYFLDGSSSERVKEQSPSARGELEITDLLNSYLEDGKFNFKRLSRGTVWLDMGTPDGLSEAADFVRIVQRRQQIQIACLEEVALNLGYISQSDLESELQITPSGPYREYLERLIR